MTEPAAPPRGPGARHGLALALWALLAVVVAGWLALVEVFWLPLRIGGVLVPLSVLGAVLGTPLLVGAARWASGSRLVAVLPAAVWTVVALAAAVPRREGDLVLVGNGAEGVVGLVFLLGGVAAAAISAGRVSVGRGAQGRPRRR